MYACKRSTHGYYTLTYYYYVTLLTKGRVLTNLDRLKLSALNRGGRNFYVCRSSVRRSRVVYGAGCARITERMINE